MEHSNDGAAVDFANAAVSTVSDVQRSSGVDGQPGGGVQLRQQRSRAITGEAWHTGPAGECKRTVGSDAINLVRSEVGNVKGACGIESDIARLHQLSAGGRPALPEVRSRKRAAAGDGLDRAIVRDFAHARIPQVSDVEVTFAIEREPVRLIELGRAGRSAVA